MFCRVILQIAETLQIKHSPKALNGIDFYSDVVIHNKL